MPVYEFLCPSCNAKFEVLRPMSRHDEDADCPTCASRSAKTMSVIARVSLMSVGEMLPMCADGDGGGGMCCGGACMHGA